MKFSEAMKLLEEGKKVRVPAWGNEEYIWISDNRVVDENGNDFYFKGCHFAYNWEEYIEPETKKIEKLSSSLEGIIDPTINERYLMRSVQANTDKINELIDRMNELCGEKQ